MIDPTIPLGFKPTTEAPNLPNMFLQGQQLAIQRQAAAQEAQLRAQQIQAATRANQAADLEQQDQAKLRQVYTQSGGDPEKTIQGAIAAGVSPKNVQALQQHFADYAEKVAKTHSDELATNKYRDDQMLGLIDQVEKASQGDQNQYAQAWPQYYAAAVKLDPSAAQHLSPMAPPTADQLAMARTGYATHDYFVNKEKAKREQQTADAASLNAQTNQARLNAELGGLQAESDKKQAEAKRYQQLMADPSSLPAVIAGSIDPKKYPDEYNRTLNEAKNQTSIEGINSVISRHSELIGQGERTIANETNPKVIQARVSQAVAEAQALRANDNPAVAHVPIAQQATVIKQAQDIDGDYIAAKNASETLGRVIDMARNNPVANSNTAQMMAAATMAVSGIKRVPPAAVEGNENAGGIADSIAGKLQKWGGKGPIPSDILDDMEQLRRTMAGGAYKTYTDRLGSLKRSGANFAPQFSDPNAPVKMKAPDGTVKEVDPSHVEHFKSLGATVVQ